VVGKTGTNLRVGQASREGRRQDRAGLQTNVTKSLSARMVYGRQGERRPRGEMAFKGDKKGRGWVTYECEGENT